MSSDQRLSPPEVLVDYDGIISLKFRYDDECICHKQGNTDFVIPDFPITPQTLLQCLTGSGKPVGPIWVYCEGEWVTYDERLHEIPQSEPEFVQEWDNVPWSKPELPECSKPRQLDLSARSEVEVNGEATPTYSDPPSDEDVDKELDEPSDDVEEDKNEEE